MPLTKSFRSSGLDVLRSVAIVWVMLYHGFLQNLKLPFEEVSRFGWMGVDLFFVLSGYLIGSQLFKEYALGHPPMLWQFYRRRIFRVFPAYYVILALYFAFSNSFEEHGLQPFWQFLTFTTNLFSNYETQRLFSHAWSLCVEEHFYLFFPLIVMTLMRNPYFEKALFVCLTIFIVGLSVRSYIWIHDLLPYGKMHSSGVIKFSFRYYDKIYFPTYTRLDGLLCGVILAGIKYFRPLWWGKTLAHGFRIFLLGVFLLAMTIWIFSDRQSFLATVLGFPLLAVSFSCLLIGAVSPDCFLSRMKVPFVGSIALLSYSAYLCHKQIFFFASNFFAPWIADGGYLALGIYLLTTFLAAGVLYCFVERPFLKLRNRYD